MEFIKVNNILIPSLKLQLNSSFKLVCLFIVCSTIFSNKTYCQENLDYDEISVSLNVQKIGTVEMGVVIRDQVAYLPVKDILDFIKIRNTLFLEQKRIEGFFMSPDNIFSITKSKITYKDKEFLLSKTDLIATETNLYLKQDYFGKVFGLNCSFNFRSLSVLVNTDIELPAIKEMKTLTLRQNINKLNGEKIADTIIPKKYIGFKLGVADWTLFNNYQTESPVTTRLNVTLGGILFGGEASAVFNANINTPLNGSDQFYRWRHVNNNFNALRQVTVGNIFAQSTSTLFAPISGVQFTNSPSTYRKSFGTYTISDKTEPGWTVELFVNNVLVNYTKSDASGFFTFDIPLVYGNSEVKFKFYGPWGEVRTSEQQILIPFNFLPQNQFEYTVTSGIVQDEDNSKFIKAAANFGLNKRITIGGGVEYLSSANRGKPMPYINTSIRLGSNFLFSGEHVNGVVSRGILTYSLPSNIRVELNYSKYEKNQTAIKSGKGSSNNYLEERKLVAIFPLRSKKISAYSRLTINQLVLPTTTFNVSELLISAIIKNSSVNLTTTMAYSDPSQKLFNTNFSISTRLPKGIRFIPLIQYDYVKNNVIRIRAEFEKSITNRGFLNFTYERDLVQKTSYYTLGFRYNFSFAQLAFFGKRSNDVTSIIQTINGSLIYNDHSKMLIASNQTNVGRGGLIIQPFLDINGNGIKDNFEPKVSDISIKVNAGTLVLNKKDSSFLVTGLEAYNNYFIDVNKNSFENITWKVRKPIIQFTAEPNHLKTIEIPISVMGEADGSVELKNAEVTKGIGRIIVNFFTDEGVFVDRVLTESDGFFSYIGLAPGKYYVSVDENQLKKLNFTANKNKIVFNIKPSKEGDIVEGLKFKIISN